MQHLINAIMPGIAEIGVTQNCQFLWACYRLGITTPAVIDPAFESLFEKLSTQLPKHVRRQRSVKVLGSVLEVCGMYQRGEEAAG